MNILELDKKITEYCEKNKIFGSIRITVKDEIKYQKSFGLADIENNILFSEDSMFSFYSMSKPFCAMGLMKLKERGLVDLDVHPSKYVPEAKGFDERVTIRHMLHHVSGLPDFEMVDGFAQKYAPGLVSKTREHLKILTTYPQYFPPDTKTKYSNINFTLCALIIENVSGMAYPEYMKNEVFEPLGMKTAVVDNEKLFIPNRVEGYDLDENGVPFAVGRTTSWMLGGGDIVGTLDDAYALNRAIKHKLLLNEDTWKEILTPSPINKFGMGCTVSVWHAKNRIHHNGGHLGFRTFHVYLPDDDFDLIILSNSGYGSAREDLSEIVHNAFYGEDGSKIQKFEMDKGYIKQ